ncbi:MAG: divalent-cation tolerance protein CutA [Thermoanaerobaculia bacterium]
MKIPTPRAGAARRTAARNKPAKRKVPVRSTRTAAPAASSSSPGVRRTRKPAAKATAAARVLVVVTTVGTEQQALDIAHYLVANRLAACVNILPGVRSVFRWKGRVNDDGEFLLLVKTVERRLEAVKAAMRELNVYELPEILGFPASFADAAFARWVDESSSGAPDPLDADEF